MKNVLYDTQDMIPRNPLEEKMARLMCALDRVDPEHESVGLGFLVPHGHQHRLWEVRVPQARSLLKFLRDEGILKEVQE